MNIAIFSLDGLLFIFRWMHFFFGIIWIGLLYYFNFVQGAFFAETDAATKSGAIQKLVPRALWWFRYAALWTWITGLAYLSIRGHQLGSSFLSTSYGVAILIGAFIATLMFINVWTIIWPNQKIVIESATLVAQGKPALPEAAAAAARAGLASRHNVLFSIPMLFMMGAASHLPIMVSETAHIGWLAIVIAVIFGALELNAIKGKLGPLTKVSGVIHMGILLSIALYAIIELMTK